MKYPKKLNKGDTVGIICACSPVSAEREDQCVEAIMKMGYKVKKGDNISTCIGGYMAGTGETRGRWVNKMFADPEVDAIFCVRGGDAGNQAMEYVDLDIVRDNPKIFVGYSDVTSFHLAFNQQCGLVTFHGPMVSSNMVDNFDAETEASFYEAINADEDYGFRNPKGFDLQAWHPGRAEGALTGGNITLLSASLGTPYEVDTKGKILFMEEVHGNVDETDRIVWQLRNAGKFRDAAGILLGQFTDCRNAHDDSYGMLDMMRHALEDYTGPVMINVQSGHGFPMMTLPMGAGCSFDTETRTIRFHVSR